MHSIEHLLIIILTHGTRNDEQSFQRTINYIQRDMEFFFRHQISVRQIRRIFKQAEEQGLIERHRHDQENGRLGPKAQATSYKIPDLKKTLQAILRSVNGIRSLSTNESHQSLHVSASQTLTPLENCKGLARER